MLDAVLEAAAVAVAALLADPRSVDGAEWADRIEAWQSGPIRKVVRRARGAPWRQAQEEPGVTVTRAGAEVRAFPPVRMSAVPPLLSRLQVAGLQVAEPADPAESRHRRPPPGFAGLVVAMSPHAEMSPGKAAAQTGHAAHIAWNQLDRGTQADWAAAGFPLVIIHPDPARWAAFVAGTSAVVTDAGFTEVAPGTRTAAARWAWNPASAVGCAP